MNHYPNQDTKSSNNIKLSILVVAYLVTELNYIQLHYPIL